jgi:hypothetical protein
MVLARHNALGHGVWKSPRGAHLLWDVVYSIVFHTLWALRKDNNTSLSTCLPPSALSLSLVLENDLVDLERLAGTALDALDHGLLSMRSPSISGLGAAYCSRLLRSARRLLIPVLIFQKICFELFDLQMWRWVGCPVETH